jgi:predicted dinucleotide-binding enzyme
MKIGIIGAGQIGGADPPPYTLGHEVFVANSRDPETLSDLAAETGATAERSFSHRDPLPFLTRRPIVRSIDVPGEY